MSVYGADLGVYDISGRVDDCFTSAEATEWCSDTALLARAGSVVRSSSRLVLTGGSSVGTHSGAGSYDGDRVSGVAGVNARAVGVDSVTVSGANFGGSSTSPRGRAGMSGAEATKWASGTTIVCRGAAGVARSLLMAASVFESVGSVSGAVSIDLGSVSCVAGGNFAATGSWFVGLIGAGLGLDQQTCFVRGGESASEATSWVSDTTVLSAMGRGVAHSSRAALTVGTAVGSSTSFISCSASAISALLGRNGYSRGGSVTSVSGTGFGADTLSVGNRAGRTAAGDRGAGGARQAAERDRRPHRGQCSAWRPHEPARFALAHLHHRDFQRRRRLAGDGSGLQPAGCGGLFLAGTLVPAAPRMVVQLRPDRLTQFGFRPLEVLEAVQTAYEVEASPPTTTTRGAVTP